MRRLMTILAATILASSLLTVAAEARGGGYMAAAGNNYLGIRGNAGPSGWSLHHGAKGRSWSGGAIHSGDSNCYFPDEASKYPPWPPFCS
jgi:hypothetical protein